MKRLSAAMLLLLLSVMFTIGGSMAYDNAVYGEESTYSSGTIERNNVMSAGSTNIEIANVGDITGEATSTIDKIFSDDQKWEPGYMGAYVFKVDTSVDVKYNISLSLQSGDKLSILADVIDVYYLEADANAVESKVDFMTALNHVGTVREVIEANNNETGDNTHKLVGTLAQSSYEQPVSIVFKMRESANNNYQGKSLCEKGFTIKFSATQTN